MPNSLITFKAVVDTKLGFYCHLLEIDNYKIIINLGCSPSLDLSKYEEVTDLILSADCILLSHSEVKYIGALPYIHRLHYYGKVYSTTPIRMLGQITMMELNSNLEKFYSKKVFTEEEIKASFENITPLKYSQPISLGNKINITAYSAGHSFGGCVWKISQDPENIIIGMSINHKKENHTDGIDLTNLNSSFLFIIDTDYVFREHFARKDRDNNFLRNIEETLEKGCKVLIPICYSRFLEVALIVDEYLLKRKDKKKAACLSFYGNKFRDYVKSMLEWAGELASKKFSADKVNPFNLENIKFIESYSDLNDKFSIIIVIDEYLSYGNSKMVLKDICKDENNTIIFPVSVDLLLTSEENLKNENKLENACFYLQNKLLKGERRFFLNIPKIIPLEEEEIEKITKNELEKLKDEKIMEDYILKQEEESEELEVDVKDLKKMFWYEYTYDLWIDEETKEFEFESNFNKFPVNRKSNAYDEYGEFINKENFINKNATSIVGTEVEKQEECEVEKIVERKFEKVINEFIEINVKCKIAEVDFDGISDLKSIKTVLETLSPEKLVFIESIPLNSEFIYHFCKYNQSFKDVFLLKYKDTINLSSDLHVSRVRLNEDFSEKIKITNLGNETFGAFKGKITKKNDELFLNYLGPLEDTICLGNIKMGDLRRKFIEENFKAEVINNILVIEDKIKIIKNDDVIVIEGEVGALFYSVKNVLYQNLAFVN